MSLNTQIVTVLATRLTKARVIFTVFSYTDTSNLEKEPELFLSLHLHLHHSRLSIFDVRYRHLQLREQVDDATLTNQNCAVGVADSER